MATEARPCHKRVSTVEIMGLSSEFYNKLYTVLTSKASDQMN